MEKKINNIKKTGATFTPKDLARFLAEKIYKYSSCNEIKVLDPACGDGALLMAMADVLKSNDVKYELFGVDSNSDYLPIAKKNILHSNKEKVTLTQADFLEIGYHKEDPSLFPSEKSEFTEFADIIIANPPYVRTQILGKEQAQLLSKKFELKGRVDLYYPFLIAMTNALKENGIIGALTSNRYLSTKSGESVRKFLVSNYDILEIIDLGDTKLFEAAVLPAIFIGKKKKKANNITSIFSKIYEESNGYRGKLMSTGSVYDILDSENDGYFTANCKKYKKSSGILKFGSTKECTWSMFSKDEGIWVNEIKNNSKSVVKDHLKVRVGIKTTADKVFISNSWDNLGEMKPEEELLKGLISQESIQPWNNFDNKNLKVLYPYKITSKQKCVIDIEKYPNAKAYFERHEKTLKNRKYLIDSGRKWFEIWVPHNPYIWNFPKLVFPDISISPRFCYDNTGKIVNGNCYWIVAEKEKQNDLLFLIQGIANSNLMTKYHDLVFNNKLYSGRRRYISQYIENYPLPDMNSKESADIIEISKELNLQKNISASLLEKLEIAVAKAFNTKPVFNLD